MNDKELWELEKSTKWYKKLAHLFSTDDVFRNNEVRANLFVSLNLIILACIIVMSYGLTVTGVFEVPLARMQRILAMGLPALALGIILCQALKGGTPWLKFVLLAITLYVCILIDSLLSLFVALLTVVPVVLSTRYYSRKFTIWVAVLSILGMIASELVYGHIGLLDLNLVTIPAGTVLTVADGSLRQTVVENGYNQTAYIVDLFRGSFATRMLFFSVIAAICAEMARRAHEMVLEQTEISQKTEALNTELSMAKNIQEAALPKLVPAFPEKPELNISASMAPAKEVGGDFYDYYLLDDDHVMMVIADVSGKSVPAALFMMISKILLKTYSGVCRTPAQIAEKVNRQLCDGNETDMFVTAWIGVLEISTGTVTAVDAGHEYPFLRHAGGSFELIKGKKSVILAGMEQARFHEFTFHMDRNDVLFLYTDGVPEATNASMEMFGLQRLEDSLNRHQGDEPDELLRHVREDVDGFVAGAEQFDDLTMLALHFMGSSKADSAQ